MLNNWIFQNDNFVGLNDVLKLEDIDHFSFAHCFNFDVVTYLRYAILGVKKYLMRDKDENMPRNRIVFRRLKLLDRFVKSIPWIVAFYYIFIKYDVVQVCKTFFGELFEKQ